MKKRRLTILLMVCLSLWGGIHRAFAQDGDEFNPPNPAEPAAIDYCRLIVSADPAEGAYVSGGGKYLVNGNTVYVSTSARNTYDYTYTFQYWTLNGERTSYGQNFRFTPQNGRYELVAHYEKAEVIFDPNNPEEPSSSGVKRRYYLYLDSSIEGAGSFNIASGNKHEEKSSIYVKFYLNPGYQFDGWKLNGTIVSTSTGFYLTMPSANSTLEACITEVPFDPESPMDPSGSGSGVDVSGRQIVDLAIGNADNVVDKTRVVFNDEKTLGYDTGSDAAKFISTDAAYQIYSLDSEGTMYSINQRPADNGKVPLGIIVKNAGEVTISVNRMERSVSIYDKLLDVSQDLSVNGYTFNATPGTVDDRFVLMTEADPVTITANSYTIKYGDELPAFGYTSEGATLEGTPSITCEATETSAAGEYAIVAGKGTVTNYNVTYVDGKLTISKAPLKITARDYTIKQGEPLPTFEADYDGFRNDETAEVLTKTPVIATVATSASEPGEYDITVSGAEAKNYEISYVSGKLTIIDADPVTVKANSYTIEYGDELPTFGYTSEGATLEGIPSVTCEATETSAAGEYAIVAGKGTVTNYNVTYVDGKLTISKAPLKITARDYTIKQGDPLPVFEADYDGFRNDETSEVLTKTPVIATVATSASEPGEYDVTVIGAEAQNYEISYGNGKLTILPHLRGDVNDDEVVNGTDIQAIINLIVAGEYDEKGDINKDNIVNGTDIQEVINIIVNGE